MTKNVLKYLPSILIITSLIFYYVYLQIENYFRLRFKAISHRDTATISPTITYYMVVILADDDFQISHDATIRCQRYRDFVAILPFGNVANASKMQTIN